MSGQIINSYRWTDKPLMLRQSVLAVVLALIVLILSYRYSKKMKRSTHVHAFTQSSSSPSDARTETEMEMERVGILGILQPHFGGASGKMPFGTPQAGHAATIQERPLFDGMLVTLEVALDQSISSASGDSSAEVSVTALVGNDNTSDAPDGLIGSKLSGTFQANFDTQRMMVLFHELRTPDGRSYPVAGIGFNSADQSPGVPADYASGTGLRLLGAGLGTVINTAEQIGTARVLQNNSGQDGIAAQELNQALTQSGNQAGSSLSDAATHDLKNTKAVLSLKAGTRFQVKLRAVNGASL